MFASFLTLALTAQQVVIPLGKPPQVERPKAPIEEAGPLWARTCGDSTRLSFKDWLAAHDG